MAKDQYVITKHLTGLNAAKKYYYILCKKNHFTIFLKTIICLHTVWELPRNESKRCLFRRCVETQSWRSTSWVPLQKRVQNKRSSEQWKTFNETFESYHFCDAPHSLFRVCGYEVTLTREHLMFMK